MSFTLISGMTVSFPWRGAFRPRDVARDLLAGAFG
jgi:hypothetical protein